jgi:hypothetical protein
LSDSAIVKLSQKGVVQVGQDVYDVFAKTILPDAEFLLMPAVQLLWPHGGTVIDGILELGRRSAGGLSIDGRATVASGTLQFDGSKLTGLLLGQREVDYTIDLRSAVVTVEKSLAGGPFPSSRLITLRRGAAEVRLATPNGHGDLLGAAMQSWT